MKFWHIRIAFRLLYDRSNTVHDAEPNNKTAPFLGVVFHLFLEEGFEQKRGRENILFSRGGRQGEARRKTVGFRGVRFHRRSSSTISGSSWF